MNSSGRSTVVFSLVPGIGSFTDILYRLGGMNMRVRLPWVEFFLSPQDVYVARTYARGNVTLCTQPTSSKLKECIYTLYMRVYLSTREVAALSCEFSIPFCIVSESGSVRNHHFSSMTFVTSTRLCPNRYLWPATRPTYTMGSSSLILGFTEALFCDFASIHFPPDSDEPSSDSPETLRPYTPHPTT